MKELINLLKTPIITIGVFGLMVTSEAVSASLGDFKFYAGGGLDYNTYKKDKEFAEDLNEFKTKGMGLLAPIVGIKFHENFGLELGYSFNNKFKMKQNNIENTSINAQFNVKVRNVYLDFIGFIPVRDQFELIAGAGLGRLMFKGDHINFTNVPAGISFSSSIKNKNKTSWRIKLGAQYNITNNLGIRALATYQNVKSKLNATINVNAAGLNHTETDSGKIVKNMKSIGLTAIYTF